LDFKQSAKIKIYFLSQRDEENKEDGELFLALYPPVFFVRCMQIQFIL